MPTHRRLRPSYLSGLFAIFAAIAPMVAAQATHYDLRRVGLGKEITVIVVFSEAVPESLAAVPFYKSLADLPRMDGITRRLVVIAPDGIGPAEDVLKAQGLKPHRVTSGPSPVDLPLPVRGAPAVVVLNAEGTRVGAWEGALTSDQQREIVRAVTGAGK